MKITVTGEVPDWNDAVGSSPMPRESVRGATAVLAGGRARLLRGSRRFYGALTTLGPQVYRRYGVSRRRQIAEVLYYQWRLGAGQADYYMFELYRRDLDDEDRQRFLMQAAWNGLSRLLNQPDRRSDDSKLALARHFAACRIPAPRTLGYTAANPPASSRMGPEFIPLADLSRAVPASGCVLKPDRSTWGRDVLVFKSCDNGVFEHVNGRRFDTATLEQALRQRGGNFLVQERLENHSEFAGLGLASLATLRLLTYGTGDDIRVARAALRLPVGRHGVDNYHAGGIAAAVNVDTGVIGPAVDAKGFDWLSAHPESGKQFDGLTVPLWDEVLRQTRHAAMSMPDYRCVGWDVAVASTGVWIIEANSVWGTDVVQRPHRTGMWQGDFRRWCVDSLTGARLAPAMRRWLGL